MIDLGMNERAWGLADRMVDRAADLGVAVHTLASGARVIDAGAGAPGGFAAGATANVIPSGATPALRATQFATSSVGSVRPSSTSTPRVASSA